MKTLGWLALIAAAIAGAWWWYRRSGGQLSLPFLPAPDPGLPPGAYPPAVPATAGQPSGGWLDTASAYGNQAIDKFGAVSQDVFLNMCGSSKGCQTAAPIAHFAGKATAAVTVKSIEYAAKGAEKVWHALTPW